MKILTGEMTLMKLSGMISRRRLARTFENLCKCCKRENGVSF